MSSESCCDKIKKFFSCCPCFKPVPRESSVNQSSIQMDMPEESTYAASGPMILNSYKKRLAQSLTKEYKWKMVEGSYIYQDKTCSICLADNANIMLECNHFFHKPCLWKWYTNKKSCPNCRRTTKILDIFCEVCFFEYYSSYIEDEMKEKTIDSYGLPVTRICQSCSKDKERRLRESVIVSTSDPS